MIVKIPLITDAVLNQKVKRAAYAIRSACLKYYEIMEITEQEKKLLHYLAGKQDSNKDKL